LVLNRKLNADEKYVTVKKWSGYRGGWAGIPHALQNGLELRVIDQAARVGMDVKTCKCC
jgi:hypothetical protein